MDIYLLVGHQVVRVWQMELGSDIAQHILILDRLVLWRDVLYRFSRGARLEQQNALRK